MWSIAAASALYLGAVYVDRAAFVSSQSQLLDADTTVVSPAASAETDRPPAPQRAFVARLEIPSISLSTLVVDGVDEVTLRRAVGRIPQSSRPGDPGDVALAGHRDTDFRALGELETGDLLTLRTVDGEFSYAVESIRIVPPDRVDVLAPADHPTLTLVTCYPFRYVGPAPLRYIVRAREIAVPTYTTGRRGTPAVRS